MRGFPARGYFIPGRDGARARPLGKVPCRRRATESDGEGWGARTSYFHPTRKQAPDEETSIRQGNRHSTRKQALNKETGTQQGNKHSTRKQALNKKASTQQGNRHSTRKQALNKETSTQQAKRHLFPDMFRYFFLCCKSNVYACISLNRIRSGVPQNRIFHQVPWHRKVTKNI